MKSSNTYLPYDTAITLKYLLKRNGNVFLYKELYTNAHSYSVVNSPNWKHPKCQQHVNR